MIRRIYGDLSVTSRPNGGAMVTLKAATGELIEIERNAEEVADLAAAFSALVPSPVAKAKAKEKSNA